MVTVQLDPVRLSIILYVELVLMGPIIICTVPRQDVYHVHSAKKVSIFCTVVPIFRTLFVQVCFSRLFLVTVQLDPFRLSIILYVELALMGPIIICTVPRQDVYHVHSAKKVSIFCTVVPIFRTLFVQVCFSRLFLWTCKERICNDTESQAVMSHVIWLD